MIVLLGMTARAWPPKALPPQIAALICRREQHLCSPSTAPPKRKKEEIITLGKGRDGGHKSSASFCLSGDGKKRIRGGGKGRLISDLMARRCCSFLCLFLGLRTEKKKKDTLPQEEKKPGKEEGRKSKLEGKATHAHKKILFCMFGVPDQKSWHRLNAGEQKDSTAVRLLAVPGIFQSGKGRKNA